MERSLFEPPWQVVEFIFPSITFRPELVLEEKKKKKKLGIRLSTLSSPIFPAACYLEILPIDPVINPSSLVIDNFASLIQVIWLFITPLIVVLKLRLHATSQQEKLMTNASKQERLRSCMIGLTPVVSLLLGALPLSRCCPPFPSRTWRYRRYVAQPCASAIPATAIFFFFDVETISSRLP